MAGVVVIVGVCVSLAIVFRLRVATAVTVMGVVVMAFVMVIGRGSFLVGAIEVQVHPVAVVVDDERTGNAGRNRDQDRDQQQLAFVE